MIRAWLAESHGDMLTKTETRTGPEGDAFFEPHVRFGIRRPASWRFLPPGWSPAQEIGRIASQADWARYARMPFVAMTRDIARDDHPRPTIQVTCRPFARHSTAEIRRLLELQLDFLKTELEEFEQLAASFDGIIGGHRTAHLRYRYALAGGDNACPVRALVRSYLVLAPDLAFTIAISTSADPRYYDDHELASALSSVRIGAPRATRPTGRARRSRVVGWSATRPRGAS